jgi:histidinol-phosphatase (PHP family)
MMLVSGNGGRGRLCQGCHSAREGILVLAQAVGEMGAVNGAAAPVVRQPGDYHVHTSYSDGSGSVEECVERALALSLPEIGIADHLSGGQPTPWNWACMPVARLDDYVREVREAATRHRDVTVLLGVEADYVAEHEAEIAEILSAYPFQYVVGAVHMLDGFVFDNPATRDDPRWSDPDALFAANYRAIRGAAEFGRFDVIAHLDYIGLWGHKAGPGVNAELDAALDAMAAHGCAIELNTDRISDPAGVMYPSVAILRRAYARGIRLVISSDAHHPEHVGRLWDEGLATAREAGYCETLRLSDKALVPLPGDSDSQV